MAYAILSVMADSDMTKKDFFMHCGTSLYSHAAKPELFTSNGPAIMLASSTYQLPLCWLLLFQQDDLQLQTVYNRDGEKACQYTTLISAKDQALQRYAARAERFKSLLGQRCDTYFDYWQQYISRTPGNFLHLDAAALWMLGDEQAYLDNLRLSLRGIEWVMSDQCKWQRSGWVTMPLLGRLFDPLPVAVRHEGLNHLLVQSGVLQGAGSVYIDKSVLQGTV